MNTINEQLDRDYADAWRPEPGEKLIGRVTDITQLISSYDGVTPYPCVTVEQENGERLAVHGFHSVAKAQIAAATPQVGDHIGVKYLGLVQGSNGTKYHSYRVVVDRPTDWGSLHAEAVKAATAEGVPPSQLGSDDPLPF